ncbi:MAG: class I SAM-dependent methyltransferase [Candidatus Rokubacteria bacterium]|nr:class I SAM-dependent methyltransferase [Candidatus Rokubacteria bacterium]
MSQQVGAVRPSDALWREGGGYYTEAPEALRRRPVLPDERRLRDRRLLELFARYGILTAGSPVLEAGCGRSPWLPYLARRWGCQVVGLDLEPLAVELARANLAGAGVVGEVLCRDAFVLEVNADLVGRFDLVYSMGLVEHFPDPVERLGRLARFLKPGGRILTTVPNLRGFNWVLQRLADLERLEMHVLYDVRRLTRVHEAAGFETVAAGYAGFFDAYLSAAGPSAGRLPCALHGWLCWALGMACEAWLRLCRGRLTPELPWLAPHVFYVGQR